MGSLEVERETVGWAARDPSGVLSPYTYTLRYFKILPFSVSLCFIDIPNACFVSPMFISFIYMYKV